MDPKEMDEILGIFCSDTGVEKKNELFLLNEADKIAFDEEGRLAPDANKINSYDFRSLKMSDDRRKKKGQSVVDWLFESKATKEKALSLETQKFNRLVRQAEEMLLLGYLDVAKLLIEKARSISDTNTEALLLALRIDLARGDMDALEKGLSTLLEKPEGSWYLKHYEAFLAYFINKDDVSAVVDEVLERMHRDFPETELYPFFQAVRLEYRGHINDAVALLEDAVLQPSAKYCTMKLLYLYSGQRRFKDVKKLLPVGLSYCTRLEDDVDEYLFSLTYLQLLTDIQQMIDAGYWTVQQHQEVAERIKQFRESIQMMDFRVRRMPRLWHLERMLRAMPQNLDKEEE